MFLITNLIEPGMAKLARNRLTGKTAQRPAIDFRTVILLKLTLRKDCLELCFWIVNFKNQPDSDITKMLAGFKTALNTIQCLCRR